MRIMKLKASEICLNMHLYGGWFLIVSLYNIIVMQSVCVLGGHSPGI